MAPTRAQQIKRARRNRAYIDAYKETQQCAMCPPSVIWPAVALDLHHRDPRTKHPRVKYMGETWSMAKILLELGKCDVLCAGHHRVVESRTNWRFMQQGSLRHVVAKLRSERS